MWDVNCLQETRCEKVTAFDLNYVGCERGCTSSMLGICDTFDLNYVGCERIFPRLFILCYDWFDLNYVGCERCHAVVKLYREESLI